MSKKPRYSYNAQQALVEVLAQLDEDTSDQYTKNKNHGTIDIFLEPPMNEGVQTDEDTDKSDDEYEFNVNHLGCKLLSTPCEICKQISPIGQDADDACMDNGSPTLSCGPAASPVDIRKSRSSAPGCSEISSTGYGTRPKDKTSQRNEQARKRRFPSTTDNHEKQDTHDDAGEESSSQRVSTKLLQAAPCWKKAKRILHTPQIYTGKLFTGLNALITPQQFFLKFFDEACVPPHCGHKVYFDNFFTSYKLLHYLHEFGYEAAGTVRENRTGQCTLQSTAAMKKEPRGSYDFRSCSDVLMIRWHDNSVVTIASNFGTVEEGRVQRWSQNQHKVVSVSQPTMFRLYNQGMGGVDQLDQQVACYRTRIRQRKWWWPNFVYLFDVTVVNAWYLFRKVHGSCESLFDFRRQLSVSLLKCYGVPSIQGRRASAVLSDVQYDGNNHWIARGDTDRRCKACGKKTIYRCEKCDVGLHPDCHKYYHNA